MALTTESRHRHHRPAQHPAPAPESPLVPMTVW